MSLLSKNVGQTTIGTGPTTSPFAKSCPNKKPYETPRNTNRRTKMRQLAQSLVKPAQNATTGADQQRLRGLRSVKWGLLKPVSRPRLLGPPQNRRRREFCLVQHVSRHGLKRLRIVYFCSSFVHFAIHFLHIFGGKSCRLTHLRRFLPFTQISDTATLKLQAFPSIMGQLRGSCAHSIARHWGRRHFLGRKGITR